MSITRNKKQAPLLNLQINCISAKSAPQILSLKDEITLPFSNFPVIGLCNSSLKSKEHWFRIIPPPDHFFYINL